MTGSHIRGLRTHQFESAVVALAVGSIEIEVGVDGEGMRHWFAAVEIYDDVAGGVADVVAPTSGTSTFTVTTPALPNIEQTLADGVIDYAVVDEQVDFGTNITKVKVTFDTVVGNSASHARLRVFGNPS